MNERLKELALQAGCKVMDDGEWYIPTAKGLEKVVYTSGIGLEKFAKLIVQECATKMATEIIDGSWVNDAVTNTYQHFGVEE